MPGLYSEEKLKTSFVYRKGLPRFDSRNGMGVGLDLPDSLRITCIAGNPVGGDSWQPAPTQLVESLLPNNRYACATCPSAAA